MPETPNKKPKERQGSIFSSDSDEDKFKKTDKPKGFSFPKEVVEQRDNDRKQKLTTLDEYIIEFKNYKIYEQLTDSKSSNFELFEPLSFFQLLYQHICLIEENTNKPLFIVKKLQQLSRLFQICENSNKQVAILENQAANIATGNLF